MAYFWTLPRRALRLADSQYSIVINKNLVNLFGAVLTVFTLSVSTAGAATIVHVPADQPSLQVALDTVPDGGIIEIAAGTYSAPGPSGFTIFPDLSGGTRSFTVRAAASAAVVLTGNGNSRILTLTTPKPVFFERLTFANGLSTEGYHAGAVSLSHAQASFNQCTFDKNAANPTKPNPETGGGAVWIDTSTTAFEGCTFTNNTSLNYAGAISALLSQVFINNSRFSNNRTNVAGQSDFNAGGAIHGNGGTMKISHCSFDDNSAGYVGGAIYVIGLWEDDDPGADLLVTDSEFSNNVAALGPTGTFTNTTTGGAVFLEAQTTARFFNCRFTNNSAQQGGAISSYQTITEVKNCVFTNNRAVGSGTSESLGGAIIALSADNPNGQGASQPNRRSAQLTVTDSLIQGPGISSPSARQGGGIFIAGDLNFAYGLGGAPVKGTLDDNRAVAYLTRVVFSNLATVGPDNNGAAGGALTADFATIHAHDCIVLNCSTTHFGGAFELVRRSVGDIVNTTFSHNTAGNLGGAITMFGGELNITGSNFLENALDKAGAQGAVLVITPDVGGGGLPPVDMVGTISNCLFQNNSGDPTILDGDSSTAPYNRLQYNNNRFYPDSSNLIRNDQGGGFSNVQQLNAMLINRSDSTQTDKAPFNDNVALSGPAAAGAILTVPPTILRGGAPTETPPIPTFVVFAASGGTALLDGTAQRSPTGVVPVSSDGAHTLKVGTLTLSTSPPPGAALNISTRLPVGSGQNVLIGGFIVKGPVPKRVLVRAIGPSLSPAVPNALLDPTLELHDGAGALIGRSDNWRVTQLGGAVTNDQAIEILSTSLAPANDAESAIVAILAPGSYTAVVGGANNSTGIAVVEVYDLDAVQDSTLANISTRGFVQTGDNVMIGGFIYLGDIRATNVVVRGIGPSLVPFGISNALADPVLEVFNGNGTSIKLNDDWQQSPEAGAIQAAGLAPGNPAESALLLTGLPRGQYTAVLSGKNKTGVGVIEAFIFP